MTQQALAHTSTASGRYGTVEITHFEQRGRELRAFDTDGRSYGLGELRAYDAGYLAAYAATTLLPANERANARRELAQGLEPFVRAPQPDTVVEFGGDQ